MLHKFSQWRGATVTASDGDVGKIEDVYFDDEHLRVRYLVVDTGGWLSSRRVLVSPYAVRLEQSTEGQIVVDLTRSQVEGSPPVETQQPVSRLYEMAHANYYRYPYYWAGPMAWGPTAYPMIDNSGATETSPAAGGAPIARDEASQRALDAAQRSHLRSCQEVIGYKAEALDGSAGKIDDILIDDVSWSVEQFVVDTRRWLPGGQVKVPAEDLQSINWSVREVHLDTQKQTVRHSPKAH
ncbi:MAG TPA: PRC-barrel domain-containing protein [Hydrogenophaga sp.]|nr:PRC-barrel domain-containing protein [Hydrogenophaga sp.]